MEKFDYENKQYLSKLDEIPEVNYSKYISYVKKYLKSKDGSFLDIGCGSGKVLSMLLKEGYGNGYGCDISKLFIDHAKKSGLKRVYHYNGIDFPFPKNRFNLVGSFNVLEHVQDPELFIKSQVAMLKRNGCIIIACPNFLSVFFINNHRRLKGVRRKISNLFIILSKIAYPNNSFEMMKPVIREKFEYDDDAIVVTNILDIRGILRDNGCIIVYESGFINLDNRFHRFINSIPFTRYMLPSCFVIARKI